MRRMVNLSRRAIRDEWFLTLVRDITKGLPPADKMAEARTIFEWATSHIRYVKDPVGIELIIHPMRLVALGAGDCDDLSIFMASAFETIGIPARFVAIESRPGTGYNHVYPQGHINNQWVTFDLASPRPTVGVTIPSVSNPMIEYVSTSSNGLSTDASSYTTPALIVIASIVALILLAR